MDASAAATPAPGDEPVITDNPARSRYELRVGGEQAGQVTYHLRAQAGGEDISLLHTEVGEEYEGKGLAGRLARFALDDARRRGLRVLPYCPYIRTWIGRHPEYLDLVPEDRRPEFGL
ncbi:MAG TPA: GNAT family N-acetyltransferase [Trebonia sp.]|jgi:hypothetical protein|nr:GNAT family N-acetyltransferase [Trebonia sp.]